MLKKPASFVLASPRGSTYRSVRLASSLRCGLAGQPFEHPACTLQQPEALSSCSFNRHLLRSRDGWRIQDSPEVL